MRCARLRALALVALSFINFIADVLRRAVGRSRTDVAHGAFAFAAATMAPTPAPATTTLRLFPRVAGIRCRFIPRLGTSLFLILILIGRDGRFLLNNRLRGRSRCRPASTATAAPSSTTAPR